MLNDVTETEQNSSEWGIEAQLQKLHFKCSGFDAQI